MLLSLKRAEQNMVWFQEHFEDLQATYTGQWVAVNSGQVVASDTDRERLFSKLYADPDFNVYAVQLISPEPIDLLL